MAAIDDLKSARDNVAARLKQITASPKPTYTDGDTTYSWTEYFTALTTQFKELNAAIQALELYEVRSYGV